MGGFDSYAFQIRVYMRSAPLDRSTLDRLQDALRSAVPSWSARTRLASLGRWPIGEAFDVSTPGSLEEVIQAHRPGGARAKPTVGLEKLGWSEMEVRLTGADRGVEIVLFLTGSERSGEPAAISQILVETTQRTIGDVPAGDWIERLFRALCAALAPQFATASSLGERMSGSRHSATGQVEWLTYIGPEAAAGVDLPKLAEIPVVEVATLAGGLLLRLDPLPGPRRTAAYWHRVQAAEETVGRVRVAESVGWPQPQPQQQPVRPQQPDPSITRPIITMTVRGTKQIQGTRYERTRFAQMGLREPGAVLQGFELVRCEFDNVAIGSIPDGAEPVIVRNCSLTRCRSSVVILRLVLVEDCIIDGASGAFWPTATVLLRHVVMRGPIDALDLRSPRQLQEEDRPSLPRIHAEHYRMVDWALDIRNARFKRCDIGGVPGHLVRRDPATQILITRSRALVGPWREVTAGTAWEIGIERMLESGEESEVFVACPRGDRFEQELAIASRLREAGIAEPD